MKTHHFLLLIAIAWAGVKLYHTYMATTLEDYSSDDSGSYETLTGQGSLKNAMQSSVDRRSPKPAKSSAAQLDEKALLEASAKGDTAKVETLLARHVGADSRDGQRCTPLMYAIWNGHDDITLRLLAAGANPELRDRNENNAFDYAAGHGDIGSIESLLQRTHSKDDNHYIEYAALMGAALTGDRSRLPAGQGKLASVGRINPVGQAPLHIVAGNGALDVMAALIDRGADVNIANESGQTPLYWAAWNNQAGAMALLLGKGADIEAHDAAGDTALILATRNKSSDAVKLLLDKGADKYHADKDGKTAYIIAEDKGYKDLSALLK